ncbi:hypothetical protein [Lewinella sp. LCG006]|uniref:hypothetical protein n=1 Tax=Lewinella sp. LCG006 TaxID=3231911 RepID=UPI003460916B
MITIHSLRFSSFHKGLFVLLVCLSFGFSLKAQMVNGYNVRSVAYSGTESGFFEQTGPTTWAEYKGNSRQVHDTFTENNRDEWSVYLTKSNGAAIQIDLHTKKMYYNRNFLFNVNGASTSLRYPRPAGAGWSTYKARGTNGKQTITLTQTSPTQWVELTQMGATPASTQPVSRARTASTASTRSLANTTREWEETHRDQWSVYLKAGEERLQIDLHRRELIYSNRTVAIAEFQDKMNGYNAMGVISGNSEGLRIGQFTEVANNVWKELSDEGNWYHFRETHRDEWSVYLHDASRNVFIQIDLHRQKIRYRAGDEAYRDLYNVLSAY